MSNANYLVITGDVQEMVEADSPESAAAIAIRNKHDSGTSHKLGLLIEIYEVAGHPWYYSTTSALALAGIPITESDGAK